ncbi:MAG TPA: hypothetical protein PKY09_06945 [Bacteroidia bacterium]|jgi:hypothetical protein|nr:hypothetical protein [Bacteroidia bacterium]HMX97446.1 hypothetical protein [Bacteroidia bacterium]HMY14331.1 hypothetical protein [Bacteroidia bacterium]HMY64378.1 hypothetical protein [Bacteroidia bacterium]HNB12631.1 hypothetical protein [Bacteroidia bacterium]
MARKLKLRQRQKMSLMHKAIFVTAGTSIMGLAVYLTVVMNTSNVTDSRAGALTNMIQGYDVNNGEVICAFDWNGDDPTKASKGPDAIKVSPFAVVMSEGVEGTNGLSAGKGKDGIDLTIPTDNYFNTDGIDISFDYKRLDDNCDFISRGRYFNFGMKNGKLVIAYRVNLEKGRSYSVNETTNYELVKDNDFRNYRFVYNPNTGKGEIMVDDVVVWNYQGPKERSMFWKNSDNIVIAKNMNGGGTDKTILDNFIIRSTTHVQQLPITLLSFQAEARDHHVMVSWYTSRETDIDSFVVERSVDAIEYQKIGAVKANGNSEVLRAYAFVDKTPLENKIAYYRLMPSNKPLKSIAVPIIGYRYRMNHPETAFNPADYPADTVK